MVNQLQISAEDDLPSISELVLPVGEYLDRGGGKAINGEEKQGNSNGWPISQGGS